MIIALVFLAGLFVSVVVYGLSAIALAAHRRAGRGAALCGFAPPVSVVKPLAGLDEGLEENIESFFRLDYPDYEIVFSFASEGDPAFEVARRAADRHPAVPAVFVVDGREPGANAKVNRLSAGVRRARRRYLLFSDGNVRVEPGFLRRRGRDLRGRQDLPGCLVAPSALCHSVGGASWEWGTSAKRSPAPRSGFWAPHCTRRAGWKFSPSPRCSVSREPQRNRSAPPGSGARSVSPTTWRFLCRTCGWRLCSGRDSSGAGHNGGAGSFWLGPAAPVAAGVRRSPVSFLLSR